MNSKWTDEERMLADSIEHYLEREYTFAGRQSRLGQRESASDRRHWRQFAELGWLALRVPQRHGGLEQPLGSAMAVMEAVGRHLVLEPYGPAAIEALSLLGALASDEQQTRLLPSITDGKALVVPALAEPGMRYRWHHVRTSAQAAPGGVILNGAKSAVPWGDSADAWLVSAREGEALSMFWVDSKAAGVGITGYPGSDDLPLADLQFDNVHVPDSQRLGAAGAADPAIDDAIALGTAAACHESVGALDRLLALTLDYAKQRRQFGQAIGNFQVIQHKLVDMVTSIELSRTMAQAAAAHAGEPTPTRHFVVSAAKAQVNASCRLVAEHAIQIHGGIGMTDECSASHYFRRLFALEKRLGDRHHHLGVLSEGIAAGAVTLYE